MNLMAFKDGRPSEFYQTYVKEIQARITDNATAEFHCIWKEYARLQGAKPRSIISDELSLKLSSLQTELENSDLFADEVPKKKAISCAVPAILLEKVGLDVLVERLPIIYQRALFSSWIASQFVSFR
jgi:glutamate dehydrogenase